MATLSAFQFLTITAVFNCWPLITEAVNQTSTSFSLVCAGKVPTAAVTSMATTDVSSEIECAEKCWNHNTGQCQGFVFQKTYCGTPGYYYYYDYYEGGSNCYPTTCETLQITDVNSLMFAEDPTKHKQFYATSDTGSEICCQQSTPTWDSTSKYNIPGSAAVLNVMTFNNQLYVTRAIDQANNQIGVYDSTSLSLLYYITVPGVPTRLYGLAINPTDNALYVMTQAIAKVFKANLSTITPNNKTVAIIKSWKVASSPQSLSLRGNGNVLVVASTKVQEYTSNGTLVRNISDSNTLSYAKELTNETLIISRTSPVNGVAILAFNGTVLHSYGASGTGLMFSPMGIAFDKQGYIVVADMNNQRLLVLKPDLSNSVVIPLPLVFFPRSVWFDESHTRLFVGESGSNQNYRVLAFDDVCHFSAYF